jgi:hypothetical protein
MWKHAFLAMIMILGAGEPIARAQFAEAPQYATGSPIGKGPSSVAVGDFEGDGSGHDDVAVVDATGTVSVFLNKRDGRGTFSVPPATYTVTTGASAYLIAAGKFNTASQSSPDLIVADNLGNVAVLLSNGNGTFQTPSVQFSANANFSSIVTDDLNGDGIGDAVAADSRTGSVWVLTGKGGGIFSGSNFQTGLSHSSQPVFLALGNIIDPKPRCPDLVAAAQDGTLAILSNSNDQHCSGAQSITLKQSLVIPPDPNPNGQGIPAGVTSVYAANYGGALNTGAPPGVADIVVASTGLSQLNFNSFSSAYLLWNASSPGDVFFILDTFFGQPTAPVGLTPVSMAGADIDGDGVLDLVIANQSDNSVSVLFGDGFGDLLSSPNTGGPPLVPLEFGSGLGPASVGPGKFTAGSSEIASDLATANQSGNSVSMLLNNGIDVNNNNFWLGFRGARSDYITPAFPISAGTALVQTGNNGLPLPFPDVIVANQSNLSPAESGLFGPFGDLNNDGIGDGSFLQYNDDGSGYGLATPDSLVSADFNGDGYGDVALVDSSGVVSVFLDDYPPGGPAAGYDLPPQSQLPVGAGASNYALASGNFTTPTQTLPDLVVADASGKATVLSNAGGGNFRVQPAVQASASFSSVAAGDLNGDGISDVVAADSNTGSLWVLEGTGNGGLATAVNVATGLSKGPVFVALGKFSNAGQVLPDLVVAAQNGDIEVLTNTSSGSRITFAPPVVISTGRIPAGVTSVLAQDFNQDGLAEVVVASSQVWVFFNTTVSGGQPTFAGPTAYVAGNVPVTMTVADFNGDGAPDLAVANSIPNPSSNTSCTTNLNPLNCGSNTMSVLLNTALFARASLTAAPNPVQTGHSVTFSTTVSGSKGTPTGQVTFYDGSTKPPTNLGSAPLRSGVATLVVATLTVGSHNVTSVYSGDIIFEPTVSNTVLESVTLTVPVLTTVSLASAPNPSQIDHNVRFTATVTSHSGGGTPTGTVGFYNGATALGSPVTLNGGVAVLSTTALTLGTDTITAVYSGDSEFAGSTSPPLIQVVTFLPPILTGVSLQSSPDPSELSQNVTFTATVTPKSGQGTPTGTVQFLDGATILGASTLNRSAVAVYSTTALSLGDHSMTAVYSGDDQFVASTSGILIQTVTPSIPDFGLTISPGSTALPAGSSASFTVKGTEQNGFAGTIALSCTSSGMPAGATCKFFPNTLTIGPDGSPATSTLTIATAAPLGAGIEPSREHSSTGGFYKMGLGLVSMLFGTVLVFVPKRGRLLAFCLFVLVIGGCGSQVACGGGSRTAATANAGGGTPTGSYTVRVTGAAGTTRHTTSVTLIVQ